MISRLTVVLLTVTLSPCHLVTLSHAKDLDLTRAVVLTPAGLSGPPMKAVRMLIEEVEQRSMVRWDRAEKWPAAGTPVVVVGPGDRRRRVDPGPDSEGAGSAELRARLNELAEALFQSIRAQLSVAKYHGVAGRGNSLDTIDMPLTDAAWLRAEMAAAKRLPDEAARLARLGAAVNRTDPGPGGFYDDFGDPQRQPHLDPGRGWEKDPAFYESPQCAFSMRRGAIPRAWWHYAETHYETPLRAKYDGLDPSARYRVRVVYGKQEGRKVRLTAGAGHEVHGFLASPFKPVEFDIPAAATAGGQLTLTWTPEPGAGGPGRGGQVCEVWVLKKLRGK